MTQPSSVLPETQQMNAADAEVQRLALLNSELQSKLDNIQARNNRVELDKKWETSGTRFLCVAGITYLTMNLILWTIGGPFPPGTCDCPDVRIYVVDSFVAQSEKMVDGTAVASATTIFRSSLRV